MDNVSHTYPCIALIDSSFDDKIPVCYDWFVIISVIASGNKICDMCLILQEIIPKGFYLILHHAYTTHTPTRQHRIQQIISIPCIFSLLQNLHLQFFKMIVSHSGKIVTYGDLTE